MLVGFNVWFDRNFFNWLERINTSLTTEKNFRKYQSVISEKTAKHPMPRKADLRFLTKRK
jgi:hypothetical protein